MKSLEDLIVEHHHLNILNPGARGVGSAQRQRFEQSLNWCFDDLTLLPVSNEEFLELVQLVLKHYPDIRALVEGVGYPPQVYSLVDDYLKELPSF